MITLPAYAIVDWAPERPADLGAVPGLNRAALPTAETDLKSTAAIQDRLTQLLALPVTQWNIETLQNAYLEIAKSVLGDPHYQSGYSAGRDLCEKAREMSREDQALGRALGAIGTQLKDNDRTFASLSSYHGYRGEELTKHSEQLYARQLLYVLGITAAQTGEVSYMKSALSHDRPDISFAAYGHITHLFSELAPADKGNGPLVIESLGQVVRDSLKGQILKDIDEIAIRFSLTAWEKSECVKCFDEKPDELKVTMARLISRRSPVSLRASEIELQSDRADREQADLKTFRGYAADRLYQTFHANDHSVYSTYCQSIGKYPKTGTY